MSLQKKDLRLSAKTVLNSLSEKRRQEGSEALSFNIRKLLEELQLGSSDVLGVFAPMKSEPLWQLALGSWENQFAFPCFVSAHHMEFYRARFADLLESKEFGVSLRVPPKHQLVFPKVLLVPALAFTAVGKRLGRGGGYYDQYLRSHEVLKIGVCLKEQIVPSLPEEEHDQRMSYVVSDDGIIQIAEASKGSQIAGSLKYKEKI